MSTILESGGGPSPAQSDTRLAERYEGISVAGGTRSTLDSVPMPRHRAGHPIVVRSRVVPSVTMHSILELNKDICRLETMLRGITYVPGAILEAERTLGALDANQLKVKRSMDAVESKMDALLSWCKRDVPVLEPEMAERCCRRLDVLAPLGPVMQRAREQFDALEALIGEWEAIKGHTDDTVQEVEETETTLDALELALSALEDQLDQVDDSVSKAFAEFSAEM